MIASRALLISIVELPLEANDDLVEALSVPAPPCCPWGANDDREEGVVDAIVELTLEGSER